MPTLIRIARIAKEDIAGICLQLAAQSRKDRNTSESHPSLVGATHLSTSVARSKHASRSPTSTTTTMPTWIKMKRMRATTPLPKAAA